MKPVDDLSRSLVAFDQESALVAVIELSNASWLVAGTLPGVARRPLKKLDPDPTALEHLLTRWRTEAETAGRSIGRMIVAYEAGRDGFWLPAGCKPEASRPCDHSASHAVFRLAARRARPLQHGRGPALKRRTPSGRAGSARAWWASGLGSSTA